MTRRPPRPDLDPGDRVLIAAHRWQRMPGGQMVWLPFAGQYRWRVVDRVVYDTWAGWQLMATPTQSDHPSRERACEVVSILRAGGERRPAPVTVAAPAPEQLGLFEVAS